MIPTFDIFRHEQGGSVLWISTAVTMEEAERKVAKAMQTAPAPYAIMDLKTGKQLLIEPERKSVR